MPGIKVPEEVLSRGEEDGTVEERTEEDKTEEGQSSDL
jgi:hypothetical protein